MSLGLVRFHLAAWCSFMIAAPIGCGGESEGASGAGGGAGAGECAPPNRLVGDACREPGVQDDGCPAGTLGLGDGRCRPAGIPPEMCGEGFVHDGDAGCEPILPAAECPPGQMAVPGDTECRPVMPCAPGKWGDIATDATTEHVDGSYAGGGSDGSAPKPWTTIGEAIAAAAAGATVAVAAGSYSEDVLIQGKPVVLWGVCPDMVEIAGQGFGRLDIHGQASGTVVRGLAITGAGNGILLSGSEQVLVDRVWVHDNALRGINVQDDLGTTSWTIRASLVERNHEFGVFLAGAQSTVEATVVRGSLPNADGFFGRGIEILPSTMDGAPAKTAVVGSVIEQNQDVGMSVSGVEAAIEATVVRGTLPGGDGLGRGINIQENDESGAPSSVTIRSSLVDQNHDIGVLVRGSDATIDTTVVRGTLPDARGLRGRGISITDSPVSGASTVTVRSSLIEQNHEVGVAVAGSEVVIEATVVRGTLPNAQGLGGRGINIQIDLETGARSKATLRSSLADKNREFGVMVLSSDVTIEGCLVRETLSNVDARFGDGLGCESASGQTTLSVTATRIEDSARAGVSSFGAFVSLGESVVQCAAFDLEGEPFSRAPFEFDNRGGTVCGCPSADGECLLETVGIEAPTPVAPIE